MTVENSFSKISFLLIVVLFLTLTINAFRANGDDFQVFYQAGTHYRMGEPLYQIQRDGAKCFKYPPYIAFFLAPFSILPFSIAQLLWRLLSIASLLWITRFLLRHNLSWKALGLSLIPFWGVWMNTVVSGQSSLILTALSIWGVSQILARHSKNSIAWLSLLSSLSMKLFHLFALIGLPKQVISKQIKVISILIFIMGVLSLPALIGYNFQLGSFFRAYLESMQNPSSVTVGGHYGFPALLTPILKKTILSPVAMESSTLLIAAIGIIFFLKLKPRFESPLEAFISALALSLCIHPLTFHYSFASAFPLAAITLQKALDSSSNRRNFRIGFTLMGVAMITLVHEKSLGELGHVLSNLKIKSWGVVILILILTQLNQLRLRSKTT